MFVLTAFDYSKQDREVIFASKDREILQNILKAWYTQVDLYNKKPLPKSVILQNYLFSFDERSLKYVHQDKQIAYNTTLSIEETLTLE